MTEKDNHSKKSSYLDRKAFEAVVADLDEELEAIRTDKPTDGWDTTPREVSNEIIQETNNTLPLGHIALQGDFPESTGQIDE